MRQAPSGEYVTLSAGGFHTCAIAINGSLACWGSDTGQQLGVESGRYTSVGAGSDHTCAVNVDGLLVCWGDNPNNLHNLPSDSSAKPPEGTFKSIDYGRGT